MIGKVKFKKINNSGFIFLEILIAIALVSIVFVTLLSVGSLVINVSNSIQKETKADFLAREELEAVRNFRDGTEWVTNGLGTVNTGSGSPYYLSNVSGKWVLVPGTETIGIFTRQVVFDKVSRESGTFNIEPVYNSDRNDVDTIKATVTISWADRVMEDVSYFTNWVK